MRDETVARSYAETLFALAEAHEGVDVYAEAIDAVATLLDENAKFRLFLETPRIDAREKKDVIRTAFSASVPTPFLHFLFVTIDKGRQRLLQAVAREFHDLVDEHENRAHVDVTVARPLDDDTTRAIGDTLSRILGKTAIPHVRVDPAILGGVVVRAGDTVYDGSLRRRLGGMRRRLLAAELPDDG